jgi:hypothetical protein
MLPIHWRLAELWTIKKTRELTQEEMDEVSICLEYNANFAYKLAHLYNLSGIASMIDDEEWLQSILMDIEQLEIQYRTKKPASKNNADM